MTFFEVSCLLRLGGKGLEQLIMMQIIDMIQSRVTLDHKSMVYYIDPYGRIQMDSLNITTITSYPRNAHPLDYVTQKYTSSCGEQHRRLICFPSQHHPITKESIIKDSPIIKDIWMNDNVWSCGIEWVHEAVSNYPPDYYILHLSLENEDPDLPIELDIYGYKVKVEVKIGYINIPY